MGVEKVGGYNSETTERGLKANILKHTSKIYDSLQYIGANYIAYFVQYLILPNEPMIYRLLCIPKHKNVNIKYLPRIDFTSSVFNLSCAETTNRALSAFM